MNKGLIFYILGWVLTIEGLLLFIPFFVGSYYRETVGWAYLITAFCCVAAGLFIVSRKLKSTVFYLKEGCIATALCWIVISIIGAVPLFISGEIPDFGNALFESVSGFTTTGATVLADVDSLSHAALIWRSLTHWIGGMGVLMFLLAVLPMTGGSTTNLMRAETPGPVAGKVAPKMRTTAQILYLIYIVLTAIEIIILYVAGMPLFDSFNIAFSNAATGGFATKTASLAAYAPHIQWIVIVFMFVFSVNFNVYYLILFKHVKKALSHEQLRWYVAMIAGAIAIIFIDFARIGQASAAHFRETTFTVISTLSTSGFTVTDYNLWPDTARIILVILMFVGGCTGSTSGGILNISRIIIICKSIFNELYMYIHPRGVRQLKSDGKVVPPDVVHSINVYFATYVLIFVISLILISFNGFDLTTNFTSVAAMTNNIGPGLNLVGPVGNYGIFSAFSKLVFIFDMLIGRLEIFPLLIFFAPGAWKGLRRRA